MATWNMINFQDSASPLTDNLISFHNLTMIILSMILTSTFLVMIDILNNKYTNLQLLKHHNLEIMWTILPIILLTIIAFPSLKTLYFVDELWNPTFITIKSIGHQWYWSYEYPEFLNLSFDSYMVTADKLNSFRLMDVDNRMVVPYKIPIRLLTTSADVIHSWTIPALGIKMDAIPGRINQMTLITMRTGLYYGQCSEICGVNHSFMPIVLESTNYVHFAYWLTGL